MKHWTTKEFILFSDKNFTLQINQKLECKIINNNDCIYDGVDIDLLIDSLNAEINKKIELRNKIEKCGSIIREKLRNKTFVFIE